MFVLAQRRDYSACGCNRITIVNALEVRGCNQRHRTNAKAKQANADATNRADDVWLDSSFQSSALNVVIRRNKIKICKLQGRSKSINTVIEFVIAQRADIVSYRRHRLILNLALIEVEIRCSLQHITRVDQQGIWIRLSYSFDQRRTARHSSHTRIHPVISGKRINLRMRIVGMKDGNYRFIYCRLEKWRDKVETPFTTWQPTAQRRNNRCRAKDGRPSQKFSSVDHRGGTSIFVGPGPI